jgi:hypothetical protein
MKRLLLCAALIAWSGMASAVVYKWVDAEGKVHYGDQPPDGVRAEIVELLGTHVARSAQANPGTQASASTNAAPNQNGDAAKKTVDEDVAAAHAKQCADAQDRYKKLIEGRHIYKTGDDGQRQYLTSEQIDAERLAAKQDLDTACNSSS